MTLQIGDTAPDFEAATTEGTIRLHEWMGDSWAVLFSHPRDFTPVCTTELGYMARIKPEFDSRNVKIIGLSVDPLDNHEKWAGRHRGDAGHCAELPDHRRRRLRGLQALRDAAGGRRAATRRSARRPMNQTVRNVFVIGPDKKVKLILVYPMTTGRNFDEVLRVIDSLQLTAKHKVATPVNWQQGDDVIIAGSVSDDEARETYPDGWDAPRPYIRVVPQTAAGLADSLEQGQPAVVEQLGWPAEPALAAGQHVAPRSRGNVHRRSLAAQRHGHEHVFAAQECDRVRPRVQRRVGALEGTRAGARAA